jgi:hypothetical protein
MRAGRLLTPTRVVVALQLAAIAVIAGYWHIACYHLPRAAEQRMGVFSVIVFYTFPLWGVAAAWRERLGGVHLGVFAAAQLALWFALAVALLPTVQ